MAEFLEEDQCGVGKAVIPNEAHFLFEVEI